MSLRNAGIVGIFTVTWVTVLREISPEWSTVFARQLYGIFLCAYLNWVLWHEYTLFSKLHELKSAAPDTLLIATIAVSLRQFVLTSDLILAVWWLIGFLMPCVFGSNTLCEDYFSNHHTSGGSVSWLRLLATPLLPFNVPVWTHWNEYRYWLALDLAALVTLAGFVVVYSYYRTAESDSLLTVLLVLILTSIGLLNIFRYRTVLRSSGG